MAGREQSDAQRQREEIAGWREGLDALYAHIARRMRLHDGRPGRLGSGGIRFMAMMGACAAGWKSSSGPMSWRCRAATSSAGAASSSGSMP